MSTNKNALLIFGGKSFEHDISIITALIIYNKAKNVGYNLLPVYIDKNQEWFFYSKENMSIDMFKDFKNTYKAFGFKKAYLKSGENYLYYKNIFGDKKIKIQCALNCCHGGIGENGNLTAILENCNIPISSGNACEMGVLMDKDLSKMVFKGLKLPVLDSFIFTKDEFVKNKNEVIKKAENLKYPLILKPALLGSSLGINIAYDEKEFLDSALVALEFDNKILVEKAVTNGMEEYNVACMRIKDQIIVSEIDNPKKNDEILSFNDKYIGNEKNISSKKVTFRPKFSSGKGGYLSEKKEFAKLDKQLSLKLKEISKEVYSKLDLYGVVRIDFISNKKGKVYLNEVNTVPGSLGYYFFVPSVFKNMNEFIKSQLDTCVYIFQQKKKVKTEYITKLI